MTSAFIHALLFFAVINFGCASSRPIITTPTPGYSFAVGAKAAETALSLVGIPYRFKGETPAGFDCSGLVRYSYLTAGLDVPRSTSALREKTRPVRTSDIRKGDLIFFTQLGKKYSHVGISLGDNRFIHAPSSGKVVRVNSIDEPYWKKYFLGARRF